MASSLMASSFWRAAATSTRCQRTPVCAQCVKTPGLPPAPLSRALAQGACLLRMEPRVGRIPNALAHVRYTERKVPSSPSMRRAPTRLVQQSNSQTHAVTREWTIEPCTCLELILSFVPYAREKAGEKTEPRVLFIRKSEIRLYGNVCQLTRRG